MNVLFLTLVGIKDIEKRSLYPDLLRQFRNHGHDLYIVCPRERRSGLKTELQETDRVHSLYVQIGNITKCNFIEKGISTVMIESQFLRAIKKYFSNVKFDLVLYSTPPITLVKIVEYIKRRDHAKSYLMLKDIFPQNALDLGMLSTGGVKGVIYRYFRQKEKRLYRISDTIGCMSPANMQYVLEHNPEVREEKVELCPNAIDVQQLQFSQEELDAIRDKYYIPRDKIVFVYGGNLGKPQGIPFLIECLKSQSHNKNAFFLIVGSGTEFPKLQKYAEEAKQDNFLLLKSLPKEEYDKMIYACDVGMIFLDHRFTIPNFPSRLLSCMQAGLPILACTDPNTDIGKVIVDNELGWWCESNSVEAFGKMVERALAENRERMKTNARSLLEREYNPAVCYHTIIEKCR